MITCKGVDLSCPTWMFWDKHECSAGHLCPFLHGMQKENKRGNALGSKSWAEAEGSSLNLLIRDGTFTRSSPNIHILVVELIHFLTLYKPSLTNVSRLHSAFLNTSRYNQVSHIMQMHLNGLKWPGQVCVNVTTKTGLKRSEVGGTIYVLLWVVINAFETLWSSIVGPEHQVLGQQ